MSESNAPPAGLKPLSSELRNDLERHAAWLRGLNLGIGTELLTWLVECPHYAALWKAQVDENARLRAASGAPTPAMIAAAASILTAAYRGTANGAPDAIQRITEAALRAALTAQEGP